MATEAAAMSFAFEKGPNSIMTKREDLRNCFLAECRLV